MKFIMFKVRKMDHIPNGTIRHKYGVDSVSDVLFKSRVTWFGKLLRVEDTRLPKQVLCGTLFDKGSTNCGRARVRWTGSVHKGLERVVVPPQECLSVARDKGARQKQNC
jgi:hypothetical protein